MKSSTPDLSKVQEAVSDVLPKEIKCPKCDASMYLSHVAMIPKRQVLTMTITSETGAFSAQTFGHVIVNFDKLMKAVARDVGGRVHCFIDSVELKEKSLSVGFLVTAVTKK